MLSSVEPSPLPTDGGRAKRLQPATPPPLLPRHDDAGQCYTSHQPPSHKTATTYTATRHQSGLRSLSLTSPWETHKPAFPTRHRSTVGLSHLGAVWRNTRLTSTADGTGGPITSYARCSSSLRPHPSSNTSPNMAGSTQYLLLVAIALLVLLPSGADAFGAGNIASISKIEGKNWRHGETYPAFVSWLPGLIL